MKEVRQNDLPEMARDSLLENIEEESVEENKTSSVQEGTDQAIEELEEKQEINEALINLPDTFNINGRVVEVKSKTPRHLVLVDKAILKLLKIQYQRENMDIEQGDFWEKLDSYHDEYYEANTDVLFYIINDNYEEPAFDKDWILDNIDLGEGGIGEQILDSYNKKCSPDAFFQKAMRSRKF